MDDDSPRLYTDAQRYDLVEQKYATGAFLDFYLRQIARYGQPVLELACGSGRLTIPLAEAGVQITGLDSSAEMLTLAVSKASERRVTLPLLKGDMRRFTCGQAFNFIFIPAQSLSHLHTRAELEQCFACVRRHLAPDGRFLVEVFNPSLQLFTRDSDHRYGVGAYEDPAQANQRTRVTETVHYEAATQINQIRWFFQTEGERDERVLAFAMRQFFPQEIDALLWYSGLLIDHKYGSYAEEDFCSDSPKQLIVCRSTGG